MGSSLKKIAWSVWHTLHLLHPIDFLVPADHSMSFKLSVCFAKTGQELKEYMINLAQTWMVMESLFMGVLAQMWSMCPEDSGHAGKALYECVASCVILLTFFSVVAWAVFYIVVASVNDKNMKAFVLAGMGFFQLVEGLLCAAGYGWTLCIGLLGYLRFEAIFPEIVWLKIAWLACLGCGLVIYMFLINGLALLAVYSGAMSKQVILPESGTQSSSMAEVEEALFNSVWDVCRNRSSRYSALQNYYKAQKAPALRVSDEARVSTSTRSAAHKVGLLRSRLAVCTAL